MVTQREANKYETGTPKLILALMIYIMSPTAMLQDGPLKIVLITIMVLNF